MLDRYKKIYENAADSIIPSWRDYSRNDLIRTYQELNTNESTDKDLKNGLVAAIMCKYWPAINKYYANSKGVAAEDDCHEWLTHAVMYSLAHPAWLKPKANKAGNITISNDGPNQCMNMCIASTRKIYFQAANNNNRKINFNVTSIDNLKDNNPDYDIPVNDSAYADLKSGWSYELIKDKIAKNELFSALVLDGIINGKSYVDTNIILEDNIKIKQEQFNLEALVKHLKKIDSKYCEFFSKFYNTEIDIIEKYSAKVKKYSKAILYNKVSELFEKLRAEVKEIFNEAELSI